MTDIPARSLNIYTCCAGRAGEELIYGGDEVSTINQRRLVLARRIVSKLVVSNAMSDDPDLADRTISHPVRSGGRHLRQIVTKKVCCHVTCHNVEQKQFICHAHIRLDEHLGSHDIVMLCSPVLVWYVQHAFVCQDCQETCKLLFVAHLCEAGISCSIGRSVCEYRCVICSTHTRR